MQETELQRARRERAEQIIHDLEQLRRPTCADCGGRLCAHEAVISWSMGFLDSMFCAGCLARGLEEERVKFLESALEFVERLECWGAGWRWASEREGLGESMRPACLWRDGAAGAPAPGEAPPPTAAASVPEADVFWDAGDISCGELLMKLRGKLKALEPGTVIRVQARDTASPEDIPAWCSLTGHALLAREHPDYWIRRRD